MIIMRTGQPNIVDVQASVTRITRSKPTFRELNQPNSTTIAAKVETDLACSPWDQLGRRTMLPRNSYKAAHNMVQPTSYLTFHTYVIIIGSSPKQYQSLIFIFLEPAFPVKTATANQICVSAVPTAPEIVNDQFPARTRYFARRLCQGMLRVSGVEGVLVVAV